MREIEITVSPDGEVSVEAFGFEDNSCHAASKDILDAVGEVKERTSKTNTSRNVLRHNAQQQNQQH